MHNAPNNHRRQMAAETAEAVRAQNARSEASLYARTGQLDRDLSQYTLVSLEDAVILRCMVYGVGV